MFTSKSSALQPSTQLQASSKTDLNSMRFFPKHRGHASDPGDTFATARILGKKFRGKDTASRSDTDLYQFTLDDISDIKITVRNRSDSDLFGKIVNGQGQVVSLKGNKLSQKINAGETFEFDHNSVSAGTYYLQIQSPSQGEQLYKLKLSTTNTFPELPCGCGE